MQHYLLVVVIYRNITRRHTDSRQGVSTPIARGKHTTRPRHTSRKHLYCCHTRNSPEISERCPGSTGKYKKLPVPLCCDLCRLPIMRLSRFFLLDDVSTPTRCPSWSVVYEVSWHRYNLPGVFVKLHSGLLRHAWFLGSVSAPAVVWIEYQQTRRALTAVPSSANLTTDHVIP